jgi:hypothetical protein
LALATETDLRPVPGGRASLIADVGVLLLRPTRPAARRVPVVVAVAQGGPRGFLKHRSGELAGYLKKGTAVALLDLGGMSNQPPGPARGRQSTATAVASSEQMLGGTMLGRYLTRHDQALLVLRLLDGLDPDRVSLWGDSFAQLNAPADRVEVPLDAPQPHLAEPLGPLVALLGALFDEKVHSVRVRGGLVGYTSLLASPFVHVPYDVVVPGVLTVSDLADVTAALAPRPVRLQGLVDGLNRKVPLKEVERAYAAARNAYRAARVVKQLHIAE